MDRVTIERRIRHLQREAVRLSLSTNPGRKRRLASLFRSIAGERQQLRLVKAA